jgi:hypothetical protein
MRRRHVSVGCALALLAFGASASASVVQGKTAHGDPTRWLTTGPHYHLDARENPAIPHALLRPVLESAMAAWNDPTDVCAAPKLTIEPDTVTDKTVAYDGTNFITWRLKSDCSLPEFAADELCLSGQVAASTSVFFVDDPANPDNGKILETDIVINATSLPLAVDGAANHVDLESAIVHEFGHALGLDHTCTSAPSGETDLAGHSVPVCSNVLAPDVREASMYTFVPMGELRREPTGEEVRGVCTIYQGYTGDDSNGGIHCSAARRTAMRRTQSAGDAWLVAAWAVVLLARRSMRRVR